MKLSIEIDSESPEDLKKLVDLCDHLTAAASSVDTEVEKIARTFKEADTEVPIIAAESEDQVPEHYRTNPTPAEIADVESNLVKTVDYTTGLAEPQLPISDTPVAPTELERDQEGKGVPWDARIHTKTRTKRKSDDSWTLIRNIDPALVVQVMADLKSAYQPVETPPPTHTEPPVAVAPPTITAPPVPAAPLPIAPTDHPVPAPAAAAETADSANVQFAEFMKYVTGEATVWSETGAVADFWLYVSECVKYAGVPDGDFNSLVSTPKLIPECTRILTEGLAARNA